VLGVFGTMNAKQEGSIFELKGYDSSIERDNLIAIEESLFKLWSPQWPAQFPPIQPALRAAGEELFRKNCADCHESIVRDSPTRVVEAKVVAVGTDPQMATNFKTRTGKTGHLQGRVITFDTAPFQKFADTAPVGLMLRHVVQRGIIRPDDELLAIAKNQKLKFTQILTELGGVDFQNVGEVATELGPRLQRSQFRPAGANAVGAAPPAPANVGYKARPLNGIWASAPYLHNGSLPNLDELLKPVANRKLVKFKVGSREFDPVNVGFRITEGVDFDTTQTGNSMTGHDYGRHKRPTDQEGQPHTGEIFSDAERAQLIEYMKSL
jgi:hypothetical protein